MSDGVVSLTRRQINFLKARFRVSDPDRAVELFVESLVQQGLNPMELKEHLIRMMARENN